MTDVLSRPAPPPDRTVSYGPLPEHVIDLRLPRGRPATALPAPLIVLVHGGFWRPSYDRSHLGPSADWTGPFDDIARAFDQVDAIAGEHGADPAQATWAGHSAGGHLVLWAAARPGLPAGSPWRGPCTASQVVSLAGCNSLRLCAEWNLDGGAVRALMGGPPGDAPERYAVADPAALPQPAVPVTLVHGTADDRVPVAMSRLTSAGRLIEIPGAGHFDLIDPASGAWPLVLAALAPGPVKR
jgi:acetyl esterase/lipase